MKTTRKFIPALVMLIVSAIMLSTASYAWLASNTEVSAGPMTVKANTDVVFLQISNDNSTWDRSAAAKKSIGATDDGLELVNAYVDTDNIKWRTAEGASPDSSVKNEAGYTDVTTIVGGTAGEVNGVAKTQDSYVLYNTFYVRMSNANSTVKDLEVSAVEVVGDQIVTDSFDQSLRVLVVAKNGTTVLGYECWKVATAKDGTTTEAESVFKTDVLAATVTNAPITLEVYVYYDGEDTAAKTDNLSSSAAARQVTVSFTATPVYPN